MKRLTFILLLATLGSLHGYSQKRIAITIDDIPNVHLFRAEAYHSTLLRRLDSLQLPVAIFIIEGNVYLTDSVYRNTGLLTEWISKKYVTAGNHSFSHPFYSRVGFAKFTEEVLKGEVITRAAAGKVKKDVPYFRFPYNDLGTDSAAHESMRRFLKNHGYTIAPFTLTSSDWMFTVLYEHYLKTGNIKEAQRVSARYIEYTLSVLDYLENLSEDMHHRQISHIYLCHDNLLNADHLHELVSRLKAKGYEFVSLKDAMKDEAYQSAEYYQGPGGFSWLYRWVKDLDERKQWMKREPANTEIESEYEKLTAH